MEKCHPLQEGLPSSAVLPAASRGLFAAPSGPPALPVVPGGQNPRGPPCSLPRPGTGRPVGEPSPDPARLRAPPPSLGPEGVRHGRDRASSLSPRQDALWGGKGTAEPRFSAGQWPGAEGSRVKGANPALCVGFLPRGVLVGRDVRPGPRPKVPNRPSQGTDPPRSSAASPSPKKSPAGRTWRAHGEMEEAFGVSNRLALRPEDG